MVDSGLYFDENLNMPLIKTLIKYYNCSTILVMVFLPLDQFSNIYIRTFIDQSGSNCSQLAVILQQYIPTAAWWGQSSCLDAPAVEAERWHPQRNQPRGWWWSRCGCSGPPQFTGRIRRGKVGERKNASFLSDSPNTTHWTFKYV